MRNTVTRSYDIHTAGAHEFVFVFVLVLKSMSILPPAIVLYHDISGNLQSEPILVLIIVIRDFPLEKKTPAPAAPDPLPRRWRACAKFIGARTYRLQTNFLSCQ